MSILATELEAAWTRVYAQHLSFESRLPTAGAFQATLDDTRRSPIYAEVERIRESPNHTVKIPVLKKFTATNVTADSCAPTGEKADTAVQTLSWQTFGFAVEEAPAIHYSNHIAQAEYYAHNIRQGLKLMTGLLDTAAVTFLEAQKTALTVAMSKYFTTTTSKATLAGTDVKQLYASIPGFMDLLDLSGPYSVVADTETKTVLNTIAQYGAGNTLNTMASIQNALPFSDGFSHYFTNKIVAGSDKHLMYAFPEGSCGVANWISPQYAGMVAAGGKHEWTSITDPIWGLRWGVHKVDDCADLSATYSWLPATKKTTYLIMTNVAFLPVYSSDTTTPFVKFALPA